MAFIPGKTDLASGTGHWILGIPAGSTIAIDDPGVEGMFPAVQMSILLGLAGETVTFSGPPAPNPPDSIGYNTSFQMQLVNNTGQTLNGLILNLAPADPHTPFALVPGIVEFGFTVNANYPYFTGIDATSFTGHTVTLFAPDGNTTVDAGTGVAASKMVIGGPIAPGEKLTGNFTIHNTELTTGNNNFALNINNAGPNFLLTDVTTGTNSSSAGEAYTGPVPGLQNEYINITPDNLAIAANAANVFIHSGSGNDAISLAGANGNNILDGGTGSNFLIGGTGFDTFFVDDRGPAADIWSTIKGFHSGDNATVWGLTAKDFAITPLDNQGAVGNTGLTFSITAAGKPNANLTLVGFTSADLTNGKLAVTFGHSADTPGLPGSDYMLIHAV
jgi:hypothetical protein